MKRNGNTSLTKVKSRKSSTSSNSSSSDESKISVVTPQRKTSKTPDKSSSKSSTTPKNLSVRFQNADMLTKYRNKNPHLKIENPRTTSNCLANEIGDDDEIWLCEIPNAIDVDELVGKSIKLGSKKSLMKTQNGQIECASSKFDSSNDVYQNTLSVVFQNNDSQLSVKNIKPVGRLTLYKKIDDSDDAIELIPNGRHPCTVFPNNLAVRHPLLGRQFDEQIQISEAIKKKLAEAKVASQKSQSMVRVKREREESDNISHTTPRKTKKRKAEPSKEDAATPKKLKKDIKIENGHDDDLVRIKQIFEKSY